MILLSHFTTSLSFSLSLCQVRNTLKFLLGNLHGFDPRTQAVDAKEMHYIDQYMLHLLREYSIKVLFSTDCPSNQLVPEMRIPVKTTETRVCLCAGDRRLQ